jgi:FixJ family two-component response regulator
MKKAMNIALVEDNRFHAIIFEQAVIERYPQFTISSFSSGKAFLQAQQIDRFDMIAIDFHLPDLDGLELLAIIRAQTPDIPVIIITGVGSEQTAVEAMKSGAVDYITKTGDYGTTIPRVIKQAYQKQTLVLKSRRLEEKARDAEKLETITTTASTLNHEINNPLMSILGNVELLLDDPTIVDINVIDKLKMIDESGQRILKITDRMSNLITTSVTQTAVGPMLKLNGKGRCRTRRKNGTAPQTSHKRN